ncbi:MAG: tyrosine-protein phosphatase [Anaerolineales bacterium]|nr:tyrosine-protein phosphatase [Anaerolineales bacterium]
MKFSQLAKTTLGALTALGGVALAYVVLQPRPRRTYAHPHELITWPEAEAEARARFLPLAGGVNFRDAGGYLTAAGRRVRRGKIYRAGNLAHLTEADLVALENLGVRWICDLRTEREIVIAPDKVPSGAVYQNLPAYQKASTREWLSTLFFRRAELDEVMAEGYVRLATQRAEIFGQALTQLADPNYLPVVFHCMAGKDRTGIVVALLLHILGVPEATILADYTLSNIDFDRILAVTQHDIKRMASIGISENEMRPIMSVHVSYLRGLFQYLRGQYGSIENYLRGPAGVSETTMARLRENLLEA